MFQKIKTYIVTMVVGFKRVAFDVSLFSAVVALFISGGYNNFPAPLALVSLKMILISAGILHAHIARKVIFPKVIWDGAFTPAVVVSIVFYFVIPLCYAFGG